MESLAYWNWVKVLADMNLWPAYRDCFWETVEFFSYKLVEHFTHLLVDSLLQKDILILTYYRWASEIGHKCQNHVVSSKTNIPARTGLIYLLTE